MKPAYLAVAAGLIAVPAAAQPFLLPISPQRKEEPPPTPSPVPVAPPQAGPSGPGAPGQAAPDSAAADDSAAGAAQQDRPAPDPDDRAPDAASR